MRPADQDLMKSLGIIASVQPIHATSDMFTASKHWGSRCAYAYAYRSFLDKGIPCIYGSDAPVESANPFLGIHAAVTRRKYTGEPGEDGWYPEQRLSLAKALDGFSLNPNQLAGFTDGLALEAGSIATMVLLTQDLFELDPQEIAKVKPLMTIVEGEISTNPKMTLNIVPTRDFDHRACLEFLATDTLDYEHLDWLSAQERLFDPFTFALLDGSSIKAILSLSADVPQIAWISFFAALRDGNHALYFTNIYAQALIYLKSSTIDSIYLLDLRPWMTLLADSQGFTLQDQVISFAYSPSTLPASYLTPRITMRSIQPSDLDAVLLLDRVSFPPQWQLGPRGLQKLMQNSGLHSVLFHEGQLIAYAMHSTYGAFAHL